MRNKTNEQIKNFFEDKNKVEKYLAAPRKVYRRVSNVSRLLSNTNPTDLFVQLCGAEDCPSSKMPVEGIQKRHAIHFILHGEGTFVFKDLKKFDIGTDSLFCSMAGIENKYYPKKENPWSYIFIVLGGVLADSIVRYLALDSKNCVIPAKKAKDLREDFLEIYNFYSEDLTSSFRVLAALYKLIADLEEICCKRQENFNALSRHVYEALLFIRNNYATATADVVAKGCGLNRIYLSRIMKDDTGLTLSEAIIATRLFAAQDSLKYMDATTPISDIARSVGYSDIKYFSKLFKSIFGVTPSEYRNAENKE